MTIANRLVFFLCILFTCYCAQKYKQTSVPAKGPSSVARTAYASLLNYLAYCVSGWLFALLVTQVGIPGTESVMELVYAGGIAVLVSGATLFAPMQQTFLTVDLKKMMVSVVFLLSTATFSRIDANGTADFMYHVVIYGGMYFVFSIAYIGALDRMSMAPISKFLKGVPIGLITLFLMYLSFSFFNGVFFGALF
ncbi:hypothetical protein NRIC_22180 [Enterococcus florum]|uniref:Uncharacterized protein n=1 Tax=Enterococcus florum TaxID=2480627 RepID=A0A4P5P8J2_9ENTE|nr:hypothetical protein [Enterococcus florum]GCF94327.1 hypothetical protein NRIC_22180 [Enterococcus florum]